MKKNKGGKMVNKKICKNCGHGIRTDMYNCFHNGITKDGSEYTQKLCWIDGCDCMQPEPKEE